MTTKTYALLDTHAVGPAEEIQNGGLVATCNVDGSDIHRMIRATEGFSSGRHYFEFAFYGEGTATGKVAVGIATTVASLSKYVGEEATSIGFKMADDGIYQLDTRIATTDPAQSEQTCALVLDMDALTVEFLVAGSSIATISIAAGTWYPAVSVGSDVAAYDLSIYLNFGASAFDFPQDGGLAWYTQTGGFGSLRICGQTGYQTKSTDTPAFANYDPRLLNFSGISFDRKASVWVWSQQSSGTTYSTLSADNHDGELDYLLKAGARDAKVTVRAVPLDGAFADSFVIATTNINSIGTPGGDGQSFGIDQTSEAALNIELGDLLSTLQRQLQTRKFKPFVDSGIANRPYPVLRGACRQVAPLLVDQEARIFQVGDTSINNIGVLRDQGDPLDPGATPPDYVATTDLQGVITAVLPVGKLTGDFSSVGTQNTIPPVSDFFNGDGTLTVWTVSTNPADGWTAGGGGSFVRQGIAQNWPQDYVAVMTATDAWSPSNGKFGYHWKLSDGLIPGRTYNFTFNLRRCVGTPPSVVGGRQFGFQLMFALNDDPASYISPPNTPIANPLPPVNGVPQFYTFTATVPAGATGDFYVVLCAADGPSGGTASGACISVWYGVTAELLSNVVTEVPLQPMTLSAFMQNIIEGMAGLSSSDWVQQDADDIDTRTGYQGIGYYTPDPVTIEQALRAAADSYCAVIFTDHLGRIRVRQLIDPDTVDDVDVVITLDGDQIAYPMACEVDVAASLTASMLAQKNNYISTDTDFVSDTSGGGIPYDLRTRFKQDGQFLQVATVAVDSFYQFATQAPPIMSLFDDPVDAQTEINRVNSLYATPPNFYTFRCYYDARTFETIAHLIFGDVIVVDYDRYGLDGGKKCLVVEVQLLPGDLSVQLTVWRPST